MSEEIRFKKQVSGAFIIGALKGWAYGSYQIEFAEIPIGETGLDVGIAGWYHHSDIAVRNKVEGEITGLEQDKLYDKIFVVYVDDYWRKNGFREMRPKLESFDRHIHVKEIKKFLEDILS